MSPDLIIDKLTLVQVRQQVISLASVNLDLCHHMASLGHNELTHWGRVMYISVSKLTTIGSLSHYLNQCWNIVNWNPGNKLQWNLNRNWYIFIQENLFENDVWKMAAILSRPQYVNTLRSVKACISVNCVIFVSSNGLSPLTESMLTYCEFGPSKNKLKWDSHQSIKISLKKNAFKCCCGLCKKFVVLQWPMIKSQQCKLPIQLPIQKWNYDRMFI